MSEISGAAGAASNAYSVRSELATNAIKDSNAQERQVVDRLEESQDITQQDRRETRKIPGLGDAVDISA
ncbi:hypothetical protein [Roseibium algae]|uniref:Uncharacterized protein n=1 Tax=Roseibium algae TaxID=3123038 RepID=A0ABU8TL56_9HYPH